MAVCFLMQGKSVNFVPADVPSLLTVDLILVNALKN